MKRFVIGLGFGDEGKGLVTDWLASQYKAQTVVRYSGGHQVGHCVRTEKDKHIFSNFGSGTMQGISTLWNAKTVDPVGFCREYEDIKQYNPEIKINPNCPVTTPFEKIMNGFDNYLNNGTMGVGFGPTIEREENHHHLFFQDLFHMELLKAKFNQIEMYYSLNKPNNIKIFIEDDVKKMFFDSCEKMIGLVDQDMQVYPDKIYESSQGLMLDMEYGVFPNVTRSKVGTQEIDEIEAHEYYLVTRAYQTRHGNGWCSRHGFNPDVPDETNELNDFQGEFKTRILDLDLLIYALNIDKKIREASWRSKSLVITCMDHLNSKTGYSVTHQGGRYDFHDEDLFLNYIIDNLPDFQNVFVSYGPTANDIKKYETAQ